MKFNLLSISFLLFQINLFSQGQFRLNCIVTIDGKLPIFLDGNIEYKDSLQQKKQINYTYEAGEMRFTQENVGVLKSLPDSMPITIHVRFNEGDEYCNYTKYYYSFDFRLGWLIYNSRVIFMINNLNKEKRTYHFAVSTGTVQSKKHKNDYKLFFNVCSEVGHEKKWWQFWK